MEATQDLQIDVLVPCAAIETVGLFVESSMERHQQMVQMNAIAPMAMARHYGADMAQRKRGGCLCPDFRAGCRNPSWRNTAPPNPM